jgi:FkbM family methyltransferase
MKEAYKKFYKKFRFNLSANNNPVFIGFYRFFYSPSKGSISAFLDEFSKFHDTVNVVQIGANDGITHDPIHKFIKRDQWNGVLLEPQKHVFPTLEKLYAKNKGIKTLNAALGDSDGKTNLYKIGFSNSRWATGLATFNKEVLEEAFENGYVEKWAGVDNTPIPTNKEEQIIAEEIQVTSTDTLLQSNNLSKVDFLQIDTEGFDFEVIKLFLGNTLEIKPTGIIYEHFHLSNEDIKKCESFLHENGYITKQYGGNTAALLKSDKPYFSALEKYFQ